MNKKEKKVFNFGNSPLMKKTEQTVVEGYERIEQNEQGGVEQQTSDVRDQMEDVTPIQTPTPAIAVADKAGKSINIELPLALHTRLKIACASQNRKIKDIVPEIIAAWVEQVEKK